MGQVVSTQKFQNDLFKCLKDEYGDNKKIDFIADDRAIFIFRQEDDTLLYEYAKDEKGVWQQRKQPK